MNVAFGERVRVSVDDQVLFGSGIAYTRARNEAHPYECVCNAPR